MRLHIGCGSEAIRGWTNVDIASGPGVDVVLDVRQPWPFAGVESIFAEHFIEHLSLADGMVFLRSARAALRPDGVLRLSTPNLDWVWSTHYKPPAALTPEERLLGCMEMNRAFHGWGHQFLYNLTTLEHALRAAGFRDVAPRAYGESPVAALRGLERHERHKDLPGIPSVVVVEAVGTGESSNDFERRIEPYLRDFRVR
ncbi:MAG TPA: methyltransferase domain-containing protein [Thermoanaerobaculia bacterium]|nr:methyltransferase domain-containing protein [Thermoanaerobaculia bacterium]